MKRDINKMFYDHTGKRKIAENIQIIKCWIGFNV